MSFVGSLRGSFLRNHGLVLSAAAAAATAFATTWGLGEAVADSSLSSSGNNELSGATAARHTRASEAFPESSSTPDAATSPSGASEQVSLSRSASPGTAHPVATSSPLPTDKLSCKLRSLPPRTPVVLVSCGSFNPPTVMHLRMVDLAAAELAQRGYDVWGAYLSPVADSYGKKGLAPAAERVAMCRLAAAASAVATPSHTAAAVNPSTGPDVQAVKTSFGPPSSSASGLSASPGAADPPPPPGLHPTASGGLGALSSLPAIAPVSASPPPTSSAAEAPAPAGVTPPPRPAWRSVPAPHRDPDPDMVMVYDWEARQPGYTRTLAVLRRVEAELRSWLQGAAGGAGVATGVAAGVVGADKGDDGLAEAGAGASQGFMPRQVPDPKSGTDLEAQEGGRQGKGEASDPRVRAMLLCGGDVLASMAVPGVWRDPDVILREHGVVCVAREGTDLEHLLSQPGSVLYEHRDRIVVVYDRVGNTISSSKVRQELAAGRPVRYLLPPGVLSYIYANGLYGAGRVEGADG